MPVRNQSRDIREGWICVEAYKHDGSLHRIWSPAFLVEETDEYWALASRGSFVVEYNGREWITKEHAIFYLFKNEWFNVIAMMKENGICYYCNVASPSIMDKGKIKYIDYDLDLKVYPDGKEKVLDEAEFGENAKKYGYGEDLKAFIKKGLEKIESLADSSAFPFDNDKVVDLYRKFLDLNKPVTVYPRKKY